MSYLSARTLKNILNIYSSRPDNINEDELYVHLKLIHMIAFDAIIKVHTAHGIQLSQSKPFPNHVYTLKKLLPMFEKSHANKCRVNGLMLFPMLERFLREVDITQCPSLNE